MAIDGYHPFDIERAARYGSADKLCPDARIRETGAVASLLERFVAPRSLVLELGSGCGSLTRVLASRGFVVDTVDVAFDVASGSRNHCVHDIATGLPERCLAERYDAIVSLACLHHVVDDPARLPGDLEADLAVVAQPGAVLLFADVPSETRRSEPLLNKAADVSRFFREVVDVFSFPPHRPVYLNMKQVGVNLAQNGWEPVMHGLLNCDWEFATRELAEEYVRTLFNLPESSSAMVTRFIETMSTQLSHRCTVGWALEALVMVKGL